MIGVGRIAWPRHGLASGEASWRDEGLVPRLSKALEAPHDMALARGLLLLCVLQIAQCKHAGGTLKLNSDTTEQYISKFSFTCKLRLLRARFLRAAATAANP